MSYDTVTVLLERTTGKAAVCSQTLCHWVEAKARQYDRWFRSTRLSASRCRWVEAKARQYDTLLSEQEAHPEGVAPAFVACEDIYAKESEEVLVFSDGICVTAQKPTHEQAGDAKRPKPNKRPDLDVFLCPKQEGTEAYLTASFDTQVSLVPRTQRFFQREWSQKTTPIALVALTDGARKIRQDLTAIFGSGVRVILDWYHLAKRVYENLSRIAFSTAEREGLQGQLLGFLWQGQVSDAVAFVAGIAPRNKKAPADLLGYLQKHAGEIIDYGRRQKAGKPIGSGRMEKAIGSGRMEKAIGSGRMEKAIGSGRMEKAVDQVVGMRQKKKGMSWSATGSHALALLKIAELNGHWKTLFAKA